MCTISWSANKDGLAICFNRDESITRPDAQAPRLHTAAGHSFLAPRDPVGGGTWLALRADGCALALLNHYSGLPPSSPKYSRGMIVWQLAAASDPLTAWRKLIPSLDGIAPFHLLTLRRDKGRIDRWDGSDLSCKQADWPAGMLTTSSSPDIRGLPRRRHAFEALREKTATPTSAELMRFHEGEDDCDAESSVWMDRGDRRTVSQSRIELGNTAARFSYRDAPGGNARPQRGITPKSTSRRCDETTVATFSRPLPVAPVATAPPPPASHRDPCRSAWHQPCPPPRPSL